jgi:N-acetylglucosamine-6-sulfatase
VFAGCLSAGSRTRRYACACTLGTIQHPACSVLGLNQPNLSVLCGVGLQVCCPSRSEILTGKFFHNLVLTPTDRWNTDGHGHAQQCMYINETRLSPGPTFAEHLGSAGFAVGIFGKYLNLSPRSAHDAPEPWSTGPNNINPVSAPTGVHTYFVNPGPMAKSELDATGEYYPAWFLLGSPAFNGTFQNGVNGTREYETDLLARHANQWLRTVNEEDPTQPFFLYIAPHGPHGCAIPSLFMTHARHFAARG